MGFFFNNLKILIFKLHEFSCGQKGNTNKQEEKNIKLCHPEAVTVNIVIHVFPNLNDVLYILTGGTFTWFRNHDVSKGVW